MNPAEALLALVSAGAVLWVDGDRLRFRAPVGALDHALKERVGRCRRAVVALIEAGAVLPADRSGWDAEAVHDFEERVGVLTWEAGMPVDAAEREAERLVRLAHTHAFLGRAAMLGHDAVAQPPEPAVVTPAVAVAARRGADPHRRP